MQRGGQNVGGYSCYFLSALHALCAVPRLLSAVGTRGQAGLKALVSALARPGARPVPQKTVRCAMRALGMPEVMSDAAEALERLLQLAAGPADPALGMNPAQRECRWVFEETHQRLPGPFEVDPLLRKAFRIPAAHGQAQDAALLAPKVVTRTSLQVATAQQRAGALDIAAAAHIDSPHEV